MKSAEWKTYRTRFLVQAKQLNSALSFVDPLGRTHCGRRGDYLVESSDGVISIAPRQIFEDIYVPISANEVCAEENSGEKISEESKTNDTEARESRIGERQLASLRLEKKKVRAAKLPRSARGEKLCACPTGGLNIEPLEIEEMDVRPIGSRPPAYSQELRREEPARVRRKMPQPVNDRTPSPRLGWM
jgi:hypothetical protein